MTTKVQKWGNSLGVRIPKELALSIHLRDGSPVTFSVDGETLIIRRSKKVPTYTIESLVNSITPENSHNVIDWGEDIGSEKIESWQNN